MSNKVLAALIALSFGILLFSVQVTGEESVYTVMSYEMWFHKNWLVPTLYSDPYHRPPMINWLIIGLSAIAGWEYSLAAVRLVSALSTLMSGWLIFWFVKRCWASTDFAWLAALLYLTTWQVLGGYGWKGYSDALFGALVQASMLFSYLSLKERSYRWMLLAVVLAYLGFLTKAITAFVFMGVALVVSTAYFKRWKFLFETKTILAVLLAPVLTGAWYAVSPAGEKMASGMVGDVIERALVWDFILVAKHFGIFAFETMLNMMPLTILVVVVIKWHRQQLLTREFLPFAVIAVVNAIPYWVAPMGHARYLMPIYGFVAIYVAGVIRQSEGLRRVADQLVITLVFIKLIFAGVLFPLYTEKFRPNIAEIAKDILLTTKDADLYSVDYTWIGISVSDEINKRRFPSAPIGSAYRESNAGFVYAHVRRDDIGPLVKDYENKLFLHCYGTAC